MYAVEMGSGVMIYIPSFVKIGPGRGIGGITETQAAWLSYKPTSIFFLNKENRRKNQSINPRTEKPECNITNCLNKISNSVNRGRATAQAVVAG
jgi:hypothetical protein